MCEITTKTEKDEVKEYRCGKNVLLVESCFSGEAKLVDLIREQLLCRLGKAKQTPANQFCGAGEKEGCQ